MFEFEFEDIINTGHIYLCAKDKNLKHLYCCEKLANYLGLDSPQQIIGKTDYDLFPDYIANIFHQGDLYTLNGGVFHNRPETLPNLDKTMQILTSKNQLKSKHGKLLGVVVSFVEITNLFDKLRSNIMEYDAKIQLYKLKIGNQFEFFTEREHAVFQKILLGLTAKQIAKQLSLSYRTIEDYIDRLKYKFKCSSKYQLIEIVSKLGI